MQELQPLHCAQAAQLPLRLPHFGIPMAGQRVQGGCRHLSISQAWDMSISKPPWREQVAEDEEELQPPARPGSAAAAAAAAEQAPAGKPPARPFLPVEDDDDDPGLIPDEEQIRCVGAV